ncbi:EVE domain-containing protein [Granulicella arctica]|uniref:EVE domain-containing protein n=1 Tax=Granulicella arctica TaxID=940613 RepID=UPI0021DF7627|nr:EVE domain-containing protein [Granulicella arctica]
MLRYRVGVASHDHVQGAVEGGFCQLGHGKEAPVRRLKSGDLIIYYSPREGMRSGAVLQAFIAAGRILDENPYVAEQSACFHPYRRKVKFFKSRRAPIRPLLQELTFTQGDEHWGLAFRRAAFQISEDDFKRIAGAMTLDAEL